MLVKEKKSKGKFCCCTHCDKNFSEAVWMENRGCLFCKWDKPETTFTHFGLVKTGEPFPCYIPNRGNLFINDKKVELVK